MSISAPFSSVSSSRYIDDPSQQILYPAASPLFTDDESSGYSFTSVTMISSSAGGNEIDNLDSIDGNLLLMHRNDRFFIGGFNLELDDAYTNGKLSYGTGQGPQASDIQSDRFEVEDISLIVRGAKTSVNTNIYWKLSIDGGHEWTDTYNYSPGTVIGSKNIAVESTTQHGTTLVNDLNAMYGKNKLFKVMTAQSSSLRNTYESSSVFVRDWWDGTNFDDAKGVFVMKIPFGNIGSYCGYTSNTFCTTKKGNMGNVILHMWRVDSNTDYMAIDAVGIQLRLTTPTFMGNTFINEGTHFFTKDGLATIKENEWNPSENGIRLTFNITADGDIGTGQYAIGLTDQVTYSSNYLGRVQINTAATPSGQIVVDLPDAVSGDGVVDCYLHLSSTGQEVDDINFGTTRVSDLEDHTPNQSNGKYELKLASAPQAKIDLEVTWADE